MRRPDNPTLAYLIVLITGLSLLYATGLHNQLVFDDNALTNGVVFDQYGSLLQLKVRTLSYGSFVWVRDLLGDGWPLQRAFNIAVHVGNALLVGALSTQLLRQAQWSDQLRQSADYERSLRMAARMAAALWAFHPVAVYGVAYLIQRSILMSTFFVLLMLLAWVYALQGRGRHWYAVSALGFVLAMASKEYAISSLSALPVLYVYFRRPPLKTLLAVTGGALVLMGLAAALLLRFYSGILGEVFDDTSRAFAAQLEALRPGISEDLYGLSILNQATLFWRYGMTWFVPLPGFMAIDIRPDFPLQYLSAELAGALAWLAAILVAAVVLVRRRDAAALLAVALLLPALMFVTEFSAVWIQDPFVLYRSYLWSITWPLVPALALAYMSLRWQTIVTVLGCLALGWLSLLRIDSLSDPSTAWQDAANKIDLQAPANTPGRFRPYLNLGAEALEKGDLNLAARMLNTAVQLGEPMGSARMNLGVLLQQNRQPAEALAQFDLAEKQGFTEAALYFHRGESYFALRDFVRAQQQYSLALAKPQAAEATLMTRVRRAEAATGAGQFQQALEDYQVLIGQHPDAQRYRLGRVMALNGLQQHAQALQELDALIAQRPTHSAHFARALTYRQLGRPEAARADIEAALRLQPDNPTYQALSRQLNAPAPPGKR